MADLPHGHILNLLRSDIRVQGLELQIGLIFSIRQSQMVSGFQVCAVSGIAMGLPVSGGTGLNPGQQGLLALGIVVHHSDGQVLVLSQTADDGIAAEYLLQSLLVVEKTQIQRVGQGLAVFVVSLHG